MVEPGDLGVEEHGPALAADDDDPVLRDRRDDDGAVAPARRPAALQVEAVGDVERGEPARPARGSRPGASVVENVIVRALGADLDEDRPVRAEHDRAQRDQRLGGVHRVGGHPLERLEVGLQPAALGVAGDPLDPDALEVLAGGDERLGQLVGRQVDDEVVDDDARRPSRRSRRR